MSGDFKELTSKILGNGELPVTAFTWGVVTAICALFDVPNADALATGVGVALGYLPSLVRRSKWGVKRFCRMVRDDYADMGLTAEDANRVINEHWNRWSMEKHGTKLPPPPGLLVDVERESTRPVDAQEKLSKLEELRSNEPTERPVQGTRSQNKADDSE